VNNIKFFKFCKKCKEHKKSADFYAHSTFCKKCDIKKVTKSKDLLSVEEKRMRNRKYGSSRRKYQKERRKSDLNCKLRKNLRSRLYIALKKGQKTGSAVDDLGCSVMDLQTYLEDKFQAGMTWENYGEWQIDHKIPLASFDLTDRNEFLLACHYSNLQPLWKNDHFQKTTNDLKLIKSNSYDKQKCRNSNLIRVIGRG
jgi:hypothetical protein